MQVVKTIAEIQELVAAAKGQNKTVGLVPTMGYLHQGHLSLMQRAVAECDYVVTSIFVNPLQFGPTEDLASYPRDLEQDTKRAAEVGVDVVFAPTDDEMYPEGFDTVVMVGEALTNKLCGNKRPGHFTGVATVVTKLFNIVKPQRAYFGQKDAQQVAVIKRMVQDLNMGIEIVAVPIVREADGLAMSSRNTYLEPPQRQVATILHQSLQLAKQQVQAGERDVNTLTKLVADKINSEPCAQLDYVEIYAYPSLKEIDKIEGQVLLAVAAKFGKARLIDNIMLEA
ncbi:pantoate--beta-alanine ligase [Peptococcaceae bacterium 1198_IL3148]